MPEIVEVRKYADFLKKHLLNKNIIEINILNGRYKKHKPFSNYKKLKNNLPLKVIDIRTKGKLLYFIFENDLYLISTLGLSGGWTFYYKKYYFPSFYEYMAKKRVAKYYSNAIKHLNIEFKTKKGSIYYFDVLSFGTLKTINQSELIKKLSKLGPDIMDLDLTFKKFRERLYKKKDSMIGNILVNQKIIAGIGNYLRADILWLSKISPFRLVKNLSEKDINKIYRNMRKLTWASYNYKRAIKLNIIKKTDKLPSYYNRNFFVYGMEEDIYGNKVIKKELYEGSIKRFIYYVPTIQK